MITFEEIRALVTEQMQIIARADRRDALQGVLVPPRQEVRDWDYVAESSKHGTILVHCHQGFGPAMPWGGLFTKDVSFGEVKRQHE